MKQSRRELVKQCAASAAFVFNARLGLAFTQEQSSSNFQIYAADQHDGNYSSYVSDPLFEFRTLPDTGAVLNRNTFDRSIIPSVPLAHSIVTGAETNGPVFVLPKYGRLACSFQPDGTTEYFTTPRGYLFCGHGAMHPKSGMLYAGMSHEKSGESYVALIDPNDCSTVAIWHTHGLDVHEMSFVEDGNVLAIANGFRNGAIVLMQPATGRILQQIKQPLTTNQIRHFSIGSDGIIVVAGSVNGQHPGLGKAVSASEREYASSQIFCGMIGIDSTLRPITFHTELSRARGNVGQFLSIAYSVDDRIGIAVSAATDLVVAFDPSTLSEITSFSAATPHGVVYCGSSREFLINTASGDIFSLDPHSLKLQQIVTASNLRGSHLTIRMV